MNEQRFSSEAGIAIGPILFVLALLAILAVAMAGGGGDFQVASSSDRITADIIAQANLIRNTINQCNMQYTMAVSSGSVAPTTDPYPTSGGVPVAVSSLTCTPMGGTAMWGSTMVLLPPPTAGFNAWNYIDASSTSGGICAYTSPSSSSPAGNAGIVGGLTHAASKFNTTTVYSAASEAIYNPASASQKFIIWIALPTGSANSNCLP